VRDVRFVEDLVARLFLEFVVGLFGDMMGSPFGLATTSCAVTTEARTGDTAGGAGSRARKVRLVLFCRQF
jgi:hypothetical protein